MDKHLSRAKQYIEQGDDYYGRAAQEIIAAKDERPELTWVAIGEQVGKSEKWVARLVSSFKKASPETDEALVVDWQRGSHGTAAEIEEGARKLLADPRKAAEIVAELPAAAKQAVGRAATSETLPGDRADRPVPAEAPRKPIERRFGDATWELWLVQDELEDVVPEPDTRVRMLGDVRNARIFLDAVERRLQHTEIDDDLAALLAEAAEARP